MKVNALISKVDMNGMCGRDYHPKPEDEGTVVRVLAMLPINADTIPMSVDGGNDDIVRDFDEEAGDMHMLLCRRPDGSLVQLMEYEISVFATAM